MTVSGMFNPFLPPPPSLDPVPCENCGAPVIVITMNLPDQEPSTSLYEVLYQAKRWGESTRTTVHTPAQCRKRRRSTRP